MLEVAFIKLKKVFNIDLIYWLFILAIPAGIIGLIIANPGNNYHTSINNKNPNLRTRTYILNNGGEEFCHTIRSLIPKLSTYGLHWKVVSYNCKSINKDPFIIKAEVPVLFFIDDLEITIHPSPDGSRVNVDVKSRSRIGKNDFGENKRHIIDLINAIDDHFIRENRI